MPVLQALVWVIILVFYHAGMPAVPEARSLNYNSSNFLWLDLHSSLQAFTCCELFSGDGMVSNSMRYGLVATASLDIKFGEGWEKVYKHNPFDMLSPPGFACLDGN